MCERTVMRQQAKIAQEHRWIRLARIGDKRSFEQILKRYYAMADLAASKFRPLAIPLEDARAIALDQIWVTILEFDFSRGTSFSTIYWLHARRRFSRLKDEINREKRGGGEFTVSLDLPIGEHTLGEIIARTDDRNFHRLQAIRELAEIADRVLDPRRMLAFRMLADGHTLQEAADAVGEKHRETVRQWAVYDRRRLMKHAGVSDFPHQPRCICRQAGDFARSVPTVCPVGF